MVSDVPSQRTSLSLDEGARDEVKAAAGEDDKVDKPADTAGVKETETDRIDGADKEEDARVGVENEKDKGDTEDEAKVEESVGPMPTDGTDAKDQQITEEPTAGQGEDDGPAESKSSKKKKKQKAKAEAAAAAAEAEAEAEAGAEDETAADAASVTETKKGAEGHTQTSSSPPVPADDPPAGANYDSSPAPPAAAPPASIQAAATPAAPAPTSPVVDSATIINLQETVSLLIAERTDLQSQLAAVTASLHAAKADSGLLAEGRALIGTLEGEKADLETRLDEASRRADRVEGLEKELGEAQKQAESAGAENERLDGEVKRLQKENEEAGKKLQEKVEELEKGLERSREREGGLEAELRRLRSVSRRRSGERVRSVFDRLLMGRVTPSFRAH